MAEMRWIEMDNNFSLPESLDAPFSENRFAAGRLLVAKIVRLSQKMLTFKATRIYATNHLCKRVSFVLLLS